MARINRETVANQITACLGKAAEELLKIPGLQELGGEDTASMEAIVSMFYGMLRYDDTKNKEYTADDYELYDGLDLD